MNFRVQFSIPVSYQRWYGLTIFSFIIIGFSARKPKKLPVMARLLMIAFYLTRLLPICSVGGQRLRHTNRADSKDVVYGEMLNSCICKVDGKVYNLTEAGPLFQKKAVDFPETRESYIYLISVCLPFNYPANLKTGFSDQPHCINASLCQMDNYGEGKAYRYFKLVTNQAYKNGALECYLNKTTGLVHWKHKGIPPLFKNGGLVLTLNCPRQVSQASIKGVRDIDRRTGHNPWKFVNVTHKCCCADACYERPATTRRPIPTPAKQREKADVALEIGEYGGGFFVLVLFLLAGIVITNRCYKRQPIIRVPYPNYSTFDAIPQVRVRTIPYGDIKDIKKVGEGSFGVVSKGIWNGTPVAVKRFKDYVIEEDSYSFIREATWLSNLAHRNIVQFYGVCNLPPNLCIVTEFMRRGSVGEVLHFKDEVLTWERRIKWASDAARGMVYLHANNPQIIHRDLKSYNLLVDENDVVKIADFGTVKLINARFMEPRTEEMQENGSNDTSWAGTLRWAAPEVIPEKDKEKKIEYDTKSDVFSFAMTFWEMIYNKHPYFELRWDRHIIDTILAGFRPDLRDCPAGVVTLLESWWHVNPNERPEFIVILGQLESETLRRSVTSTRPSTI